MVADWYSPKNDSLNIVLIGINCLASEADSTVDILLQKSNYLNSSTTFVV
jgi:hypothetical protein